MKLIFPLDYERLPEFWQLAEALRTRRVIEPALTEAQVNEQAILLWNRLWVTLGYLARHTSRPGWLNPTGERQVNDAFTQFGDDCPPVEVMNGSLLRKGDDGYYCDLFTEYNKHLSGDYVSKEDRGNLRSRFSAARNNIAATAQQQSFLLANETFRKRDSSIMTQPESDRSMRLIFSLDRILNLKVVQRNKASYSDGLLADACAVVESRTDKELEEFYYWLLERREHVATPKTAEEILKDFERLFQTSKAKIQN